jgi:peptidyl-prolyl cis-trans isomerase A (cyclophilin A)
MRLTMVKSGVVVAMFGCLGWGFGFHQAGTQAKKEKLMNPAAMTEKAPEVFQAKFETTKGTFTMEVTRAWAPIGADRFYNLVKNGYYNNCRFFRVMANFMAQVGIHGDPKVNAVWMQAKIKDDPVVQSNTRGFVSYAMAPSPNTRGTQFFINYSDRNAGLDRSGFAPFGKVSEEDMKVVDSLYAEYGDGAPKGKGPDQARLQREGNTYLEKEFSQLDYIKSAVIVASPAK